MDWDFSIGLAPPPPHSPPTPKLPYFSGRFPLRSESAKKRVLWCSIYYMTNDSSQWSYSLTPQEEATCARVGFERQEPYLARPEANRRYSQGDVAEIWQHSVAAGSEMAFARMVGLSDFVPHVNKWKSAADVPPYEIRYCFTNKRVDDSTWSLRHEEGDDIDVAYVLLVGGLEDMKPRDRDNVSPPYTAVGWMWGSDCRQSTFELTQISSKRRWRVPFDQLRSMAEVTSPQYVNGV